MLHFIGFIINMAEHDYEIKEVKDINGIEYVFGTEYLRYGNRPFKTTSYSFFEHGNRGNYHPLFEIINENPNRERFMREDRD